MAKIKSRQPKPPSSVMRPSKITNEEGVVYFSFKHLQLDHPTNRFCVKNTDGQYIFKILERFKALSGFKSREIFTSRSSALRAHPIDWSDTQVKDGFAHLNEQLRAVEPYQISCSSNEHGRIHGFFVQNIFYVIWFDPEHYLYS